ncbi:hypothetical protein CYLTODRAFT_442870 [Cylindrobasidium torrendii FP15055 ss-10]|uniref:Homeobox domain-containing protein n=1 Tax=Cylindrobasidium torrendii FP15055 ss-10 TaxID=1314674 RepID=A0A0D7BF79_9AGAR|nr:hypothetical protein CYLTODRAFT_442870 [Cylindrobasidium torrendii FP15055 ss-10]
MPSTTFAQPERRAFLERFLNTAKQFRSAPRLPAVTPIPAAPRPAPLALPVPSHVNALLEDKSLHPALRQILAKTIQRMQDEYQAIYARTADRRYPSAKDRQHVIETLARMLVHRFTNEFIPTLYARFQRAKEEISVSYRIASTIRATTKYPAKLHGPFDETCIQVLMAFFNWNPFPNSGDRQMLADKFCVSSRQIEVWFQNRRRESRKSGICKNKADYKHLLNVAPPEWIWAGVESIFGMETGYGARCRKPGMTGSTGPKSQSDCQSKTLGTSPSSLSRSWVDTWGSFGGWCGWGMPRRAFLPASLPSTKSPAFALSRSLAQSFGMTTCSRDESATHIPSKRFDFGCTAMASTIDRSLWAKEREAGGHRFFVDGFISSAGKPLPKRKNTTCKSLVASFDLPSAWGGLGENPAGDKAFAAYRVGPATAGTYSDTRWYNHARRYALYAATKATRAVKGNPSAKPKRSREPSGGRSNAVTVRNTALDTSGPRARRHGLALWRRKPSTPPKKDNDEFVRLDEQGAPEVFPGFDATVERSSSLRSVRSVSSISSVPSLTYSGHSDDEGDALLDVASRPDATFGINMQDWCSSIPPQCDLNKGPTGMPNYQGNILPAAWAVQSPCKAIPDLGLGGMDIPSLIPNLDPAGEYTQPQKDFDFSSLFDISTFDASSQLPLGVD